jgi:dTDP-4-amino-4,6-dideoxygalactose transaminase
MKIPFHAPERFYIKYKSQSDKIFETACTSGQFFNNESIAKFEAMLATYCKRKFAISVGSCTDALHFSLIAAGIKRGDKIILPSVSFFATVSAVLAAGGDPVFADIDPNTGLIDMNHAERILAIENIKAMVPVDLYGNMVDPSGLNELIKKYSISVIIDAAQSLGSSKGNIIAGSTGNISCISFDPTKIIHAFGAGGAVLTDDEKTVDLIRSLRYHGKKNDDYILPGHNSRMNTLQVRLLTAQLERMPEIISDRQKSAEHFISEFSKLEFMEVLHVADQKGNFHKFVIKTQYRDKLKDFLALHGISTIIHYSKPLYSHKLFNTIPFSANNIVNANGFCNSVLSLPLYNYMTAEERNYIIQIINSFKP